MIMGYEIETSIIGFLQNLQRAFSKGDDGNYGMSAELAICAIDAPDDEIAAPDIILKKPGIFTGWLLHIING